jgi:hypothetical protein
LTAISAAKTAPLVARIKAVPQTMDIKRSFS